MKTFASRRWRNLILLALAVIFVLVFDAVLAIRLQPKAFYSGWLLLTLIIGLAAYNLRKKLAFLPLGTSAGWLQLHVYSGCLTIVIFAVHVGFRIPNGLFESILATVYLAVFFSGLGGLTLSRVIPPRLTMRGEEVLYERIPIYLRRIREEVEEAVLECTAQTDSTVIPEFYITRLRRFFECPRHFWQHLVHSTRPRLRLLSEIQTQHRYLTEQERGAMQKIEDCVRVKDDLDYQFALQSTLKFWLFVHVPLTYGLLVLAALHVLLAYAFTGGA